MSRPSVVGVAIAVLVVAFAAYEIYDRAFGRDIPVYANDRDQFLYGSIGNDGAEGVPFAIWQVLPDVFRDLLPGGYASLGFVWEKGRGPHDPPVGFSRARVGVERIAINCAICHTPTIRYTAGGDRHIVLAGGGNRIDIQLYQRFLAAAARDPRFSAEILLPAIEVEFGLSFVERLTYRFFVIPATRDALIKQGEAYRWTEARPRWGPGRIDPFNPVKFGMLELPEDGTIGNSDMLAIWNLAARDRLRADAPLHWDGLNRSIHEVVVSSALGDGAVADEFDWQQIGRLETFLKQLPPPASPHTPDPAAVARGAQLFARICAECHAENGARVLTVIPLAEVGTDSSRLAMWTEAARDAYNGYRGGYDWGFTAFQKTDGYVAEPLWGLWSSGPYLHNGSVPNLTDLLTPPSERTAAFVRGLDVLDSKNGGMIAPTCTPGASLADGFCYDTSLPGNGNAGHSYGTEITAGQKADLVAYLLTQ